MNFHFLMRAWLIIAISLFSINTAQSVYLSNSDADSKFKEGYYKDAIILYKELLQNDPDNSIYNFRIGLCYLYTLEEEEALRFLSKVGKLENAEEDLHRSFFFGRTLHLNGKYEPAIVAYNEYLETYKRSKESFNTIVEGEVVFPAIYGNTYELIKNTISIEEAIERLIASCEYGAKLIENPKRAAIENLGAVINSKGSEYAPVINAAGDEIFYASKIEIKPGQSAERLYYSKLTSKNTWSEPAEIRITDDQKADIAPLYLNPEGNKMLIYNSESNNGDIYIIEKEGATWSEVKNLSKNINSKFWEPSASLFPDGKTLIFSSNRPYGYGGLDLYISRLENNNRWTEPENLGPEINTAFDEDAPFVLGDGKTIYFSSRGLKGIGGYDIFKTTFVENKWTIPVNMEMPINSSSDDIYFTWTQDERRAYFASHRKDSYGESDIYYMDFNQISLNVFLKYNTPEGPRPVQDYEVSLQHMKTGETIEQVEEDFSRGLSVFLAKENDMYMLRINSPGYMPYLESMSLRRGSDLVAYQNKEIVLVPENADLSMLEDIEKPIQDPVKTSDVVANDKSRVPVKVNSGNSELRVGDVLKPQVHFILNVSKEIMDYSKGQMDKVIKIMNENPTLKIQIVAHADLSGNHDYNKKLSEERAISVKNYFIEKGISEDRLLGTWKGDEDPIINTQYPELKNRRVEFVVAEL